MRLAVMLLAVSVVLGAVVIASQPNLLMATRTVMITSTLYDNVEMVGACAATSYYIADKTTVFNVTITSGGVTTYTQTTETSFGTPEAFGNRTFSPYYYSNDTSTYTTNFSNELNGVPWDGWVTTTCIYAPSATVESGA